jgi:hypothetical protein
MLYSTDARRQAVFKLGKARQESNGNIRPGNLPRVRIRQ